MLPLFGVLGGACFLLGIRILGHNTGPWGWLTKNASEEVCACVYMCVCVCVCAFERV